MKLGVYGSVSRQFRRVSYNRCTTCCKLQSSNTLVFHKYVKPSSLDDGPDIKLFILVFWAGAFLSVAWPTGVQLLVFFCSSVPVVLFDTPGISRYRSQHVPVESSSLLHHSI